MTGALFDTRRRALGLSVGEAAFVCGQVAERTVNRWTTDDSPVPADAFAALDELEDQMNSFSEAMISLARKSLPKGGRITLHRFRTQEALDASPYGNGLRLGAHATVTNWVYEVLDYQGYEVSVVWS